MTAELRIGQADAPTLRALIRLSLCPPLHHPQAGHMFFFFEEKTLSFLHYQTHFNQLQLAGFQVTIRGWF